MSLPALAPRPIRPMSAPTALKPEPCGGNLLVGWAEAYPEIERLYIREKRKLRHVVEYMERMHGFKAT